MPLRHDDARQRWAIDPRGLLAVGPSLMYRDNLEGLTAQIRAIEEQKRHLEADLVGMKSMRRPQRALRALVALLVLAGAGAGGGVLGYRHAVLELQQASQEDARTARSRIQRCNERLTEVKNLCREDYLSGAVIEEKAPF